LWHLYLLPAPFGACARSPAAAPPSHFLGTVSAVAAPSRSSLTSPAFLLGVLGPRSPEGPPDLGPGEFGPGKGRRQVKRKQWPFFRVADRDLRRSLHGL